MVDIRQDFYSAWVAPKTFFLGIDILINENLPDGTLLINPDKEIPFDHFMVNQSTFDILKKIYG